MVVVAQLVRASVCGTEGRRFEPGLPPRNTSLQRNLRAFFVHSGWFYSKKKDLNAHFILK